MRILELDAAREILDDVGHLAVFTGAGASAESGIPTFRDGGFWDQYPPDQFARWSGLARLAETNPTRLSAFVHAVIEPIGRAAPNAAHRAIADRQRRGRVSVITQNVDGLHQSAGSEVVHEVHGSLLRQVNADGSYSGTLARSDLVAVAARLAATPTTIVGFWQAVQPFLRRERGELVRPSIVLFGDEMPTPDWEHAQDVAESCDAMLTIGTSAQVYPAASLPEVVARRGCAVICVDPNPPEFGSWVQGRAAEIVPRLLANKSAS